MKKPSKRDRSLSTFACLALSGLALAAVAGCERRTDASPPRDVGAETNPAPAAKGPRAETETYAVELRPAGPYAAGKEGALDLSITSKGDYHINDQYPHKLKLADPAPEGVSYPKPLLKREDGTWSEKQGSFKVPFVASRAGKATIAGTLSMSVCSDANCVMEKLELEVDVDVM